MQGCLRLVLGLAGLVARGSGHLDAIARRPTNECPERAYYRNAREMRHYLNSNPIAGLLTRVLVIRSKSTTFDMYRTAVKEAPIQLCLSLTTWSQPY